VSAVVSAVVSPVVSAVVVSGGSVVVAMMMGAWVVAGPVGTTVVGAGSASGRS
jgi:hypothetical protein